MPNLKGKSGLTGEEYRKKMSPQEMRTVWERWHWYGLILLLPRCVRSQDGLSTWAGKKGLLGLQGETACPHRMRLNGLASHLSLSVQLEGTGAGCWGKGRFAVMCMRSAGGLGWRGTVDALRGGEQGIWAAMQSPENMVGVAEQKQLERKRWSGGSAICSNWHL